MYVPVGTLDCRKPAARKIIVDAVHAWMVANWLRLREGRHEYPCPDKVVAKALTNKLPKFIASPADRRLLFLESEQFTFLPEQIFDELDRQEEA
jgi:hypothetical protein